MTKQPITLPSISQKTVFLMLCILISTCLPVHSQADEGTEKTYIFGIVPQFEARRLHGIWRPILNYLQKETG